MTLQQFLEFIRSIDQSLINYVDMYGTYIYVLLFTIVFFKTAVIVLVFLPGDTLIFFSGALAALSSLNIFLLFPVILLAALLGDQMNFLIGKTFRYTRSRIPFLQKVIPDSVIIKSQSYLSKYGTTAITFSRFIPLLRGTMPFTCATSNYSYYKFFKYNFLSCLLWTVAWLLGGFILGNLPVVQDNLTFSLLSLTTLFLLPIFIKFFSRRKNLPTIEN